MILLTSKQFFLEVLLISQQKIKSIEESEIYEIFLGDEKKVKKKRNIAVYTINGKNIKFENLTE